MSEVNSHIKAGRELKAPSLVGVSIQIDLN